MRKIRIAAAGALAACVLAVSVPAAEAATRIQKSFGSWRVDCTERENAQKNCSLQYSLVTRKDKKVVFSWTIVRRGKDGGTNKAVLRTPTGVLLADGVNVGFEGAEPVKINYLTCGPNGCVAEFDFTDQWVKALGSNQKVMVNYKAANEKPIKHDVDLKQFSAAFDFFSSQMQGKQ
jgi:invasion protein IalB